MDRCRPHQSRSWLDFCHSSSIELALSPIRWLLLQHLSAGFLVTLLLLLRDIMAKAAGGLLTVSEGVSRVVIAGRGQAGMVLEKLLRTYILFKVEGKTGLGLSWGF